MTDVICGVNPAGAPRPTSIAIRKRTRLDDVTLGNMGFDAKARGASNVLVAADSEGKIVGAASGVPPTDEKGKPAGERAYLGYVNASDWKVFDALLLAHVKEAVELGYKVGEATVPAEATHIIEYLETQYGLKPEPCGWKPNTGYKVVKWWRYEVDLNEFLEKLVEAKASGSR